jgi:signal transduction histidine kinase/AraC-like DNA-binding protein/ligand-binding sensor domain-containing protein
LALTHPHAFSLKCFLPAVFAVFLTFQSAAQFLDTNSPFNNKIIAIDQDQQGFMWFASQQMIGRYDGYEFTFPPIINNDQNTAVHLLDLLITQKNLLFLATRNQGLLVANLNQLTPVQTVPELKDRTVLAMLETDDAGELWLADKNGLYLLKDHQLIAHPFSAPKPTIDHFIQLDAQHLIISSINELLVFNKQSGQYSVIEYDTQQNSTYIWDVIKLADKKLLVSTDKALILGDMANQSWQTISHPHIQSTIHAMTIINDNLWLSSNKAGLKQFVGGLSDPSPMVFNKTNGLLDEHSIVTFFVDRQERLWSGFFDGQIRHINPKNLIWQKLQLNNNFNDCVPSYDAIDHVSEDAQNRLWVISSGSLWLISESHNICLPITTPEQSTKQLNRPIPIMSFQDTSGHQWVFFYQLGLVKYDLSNNPQIQAVYSFDATHNVFYGLISQPENDEFVFHSAKGIVQVKLKPDNESSIESLGQGNEPGIVHDYFSHPEGGYLLASSRGLMTWKDDLIAPFSHPDLSASGLAAQQILVDSNLQWWIGTQSNGLIILDPSLQKLDQFKPRDLQNEIRSVTSLLEDNLGFIWVTTAAGLYRFDPNTYHILKFTQQDGLPSDTFRINNALVTTAGVLVFGTSQGLVTINPQDVPSSSHALGTYLTGIKRFNQDVRPGEDYNGFSVDKPLHQLQSLELGHDDYIMSFKFSSLNYDQAQRLSYQYQLQGFDPSWRQTTAANREATYTNLPSGEYTFRIKSGYNQHFDSEIQPIQVTVLPPPWLTWWALTSYVLMALGAVYWYVQHKIKTNQRIADRLRIEVAEKTKELSIQKQTVESLLEKKNELFSNVSHEFRTPLTLILGPIRELLDKQTDQADVKSLTMINRSANRLLSLVEQLLQIARVSDLDKVKTQPQNTEKQVSSLVESFEHMAHSKRINLQLTHNDPTTIDVTDQFIDAVLGNLVSNAIKYTESGGSVWVSATASSDSLILSVKDTGAGLTTDQQRDIFKRFRRLESHQAIEGIGIGLSVVEEVVKVNNGRITVDSELGVGSEFVVRVPLAEAVEAHEQSHISTLVQQLQRESVEVAEAAPSTDSGEAPVEDVTLNTVLVIEDNHDMRQHIVDIISTHYNCLTAENGVKGVAVAIEQVPDIIISDVMMPEMDGFKVARIIRADERTSHIPLMLLTALNDKTSRIKGWRENVDAYMTKPFDRDELLIQLENMLTIRDILKKKAGQDLSSGQSQSATLTKKDQEFVDRLMAIIHEHYADPLLSRVKLANLMAVSDRQLQRKIKALIDQNPMDILREFRLNTAKQKLRDGYQVSLVADDCGFNSLSYFSQCFKAQFGMSPKKFQQSQ